MQEAFIRRAFALTGVDVSSLVASLSNPDPNSAIEVISAQISDLAKEWVAKQAATGVTIEPSILTHMWCGHAWSLLRDMHGQLLSPELESVLPKEDVLLVAKTLVGARVRQSASDRTSIAFIGSLRCGKSSLINAIVGLPFITLGSEYCFFIKYTTSESLQSPRQSPVEYDTSPAYQNQP